MSDAEQAWWRALWMMVGHGVEWNTARGFMVPLEKAREAEVEATELQIAKAQAHVAFLRDEIRKLGEDPCA